MAEWYVVQVLAGQEDAVLAAMEQLVREGVLHECFTPRYRTQQKVRGVWRDVERKLIPGYLIAVTDEVGRLDKALRELPAFTRILRNEKGFIPLDRDEAVWMDAFTQGGERVVPLSTAVKEGDEVIVTDGPLREHAARIKRIDRRRSMAYVEISFLGRTKEIPLGLKIVAKRGG